MSRATSVRHKRKSSRLTQSISNRYEDAWWSQSERSWLPATVQDPRLDADQSTRLELVRRSRYWSRNSPLSQLCGQIFELFVAGPNGVQMVPSCSGANGEIDDASEAFDEAAARWWRGWSKFPCVDSHLPMPGIQHQMCFTWWHDGECFIFKTYSKQTGRPRIQLLEGHRIGTPPELRSEEGRSIVDGIEFVPDQDGRPSGRPVRYWIRTDTGPNNVQGAWIPSMYGGGIYRPIPADQMIYLGDPDRPGMFRSLPKSTGRMNDLHDLEDLQMMEKKAAKDAARITNVLTNKTGEANTSSSRRQKWNIQGQDANGNPVVKSPPLYYEVAMGGETLHLMLGEKFEQFRSERPSVATREFWDYLVRKVSGPMWPLILPQSVQGTQVRAFFDVANAYFRQHTSILAAVMREIYVWVMGWAVNYDRSLDGAPDEWWHVDVIPPRSIVVDLGRDSQARLNEIKGGIRTYKGECGERGLDWRDTLRQKAIEAKFINKLVDEYDVTGRQIAELAQESLRVTEKVSESAAERAAEQPDTKEGDTVVAPAQPAAVQPITVNVQNKVPATKTVNKKFEIVRDASGKPTHLQVVQEVAS